MKFVVTIVLLLSFFINLQAADAPAILQDFESDGCTMFIEGPSDKPDLWAHCCFEHDLRYWFGGDKADKKFSDVQLRECVRDVAGNFWANLIYNGVRAGSFSPVKFKYVWGWAWTPKRKNTKLTDQEVTYVIERINQLDLDPQYKSDFIQKYLTK